MKYIKGKGVQVMSKYGRGLKIAAIITTIIVLISIILMLVAPADTSATMKLGVFMFLYSFMGEIVIWRLYEEFKKADLIKKRDYL